MTKLQEAVDAWNTAAAECGWPIVRRLTADRERKLYALLKNGLDDWREALAKAKASDFLCGRTSRSEKHAGWRFNFDFFITDSRFTRILEGVYDNAESAGPQYVSPATALWGARLNNYKPGGMWLGLWGPKPGEPGCQAPPSLVEQWQQRNTH